jgi:serine/threonine protein kinase
MATTASFRRVRTHSSTFVSSPLERYQLVAKIGQGSFGVVSEFLDAARGYNPVAIKEVTIREEFLREVSILRELGTNQYVIPLLNSFEHANKFYLVMPKADVSLGRFLLKNRLDPDVITHMVIQIAYGLHGLHHIGWVHADLKPENIVVSGVRSGFPRVQIIDFGSCFRCPTGDEVPADAKQSDFPEEDAYVTTRWYRSPEVVMGFPDAVDKPIDIWALGCIAVQMLTGQVMFPAEDEPELLGMMELFMGPFAPELVETSPYKHALFSKNSVVVRGRPVEGEEEAKPGPNIHLYTQWMERVERALLPLPASSALAYKTVARATRTGVYAGDVLLEGVVDLQTFIGCGDHRIVSVVRQMLAIDRSKRCDIDDVITYLM